MSKFIPFIFALLLTTIMSIQAQDDKIKFIILNPRLLPDNRVIDNVDMVKSEIIKSFQSYRLVYVDSRELDSWESYRNGSSNTIPDANIDLVISPTLQSENGIGDIIFTCKILFARNIRENQQNIEGKSPNFQNWSMNYASIIENTIRSNHSSQILNWIIEKVLQEKKNLSKH